MSRHIVVRIVAVLAVLAIALFLVTARQKKLHDPGVVAPAAVP